MHGTLTSRKGIRFGKQLVLSKGAHYSEGIKVIQWKRRVMKSILNLENNAVEGQKKLDKTNVA